MRTRKLVTFTWSLLLNSCFVILLKLPYIANHLRCKSFAVFADQSVPRNFSSKILACAIGLAMQDYHIIQPWMFSSELKFSSDFSTSNNLQYTVYTHKINLSHVMYSMYTCIKIQEYITLLLLYVRTFKSSIAYMPKMNMACDYCIILLVLCTLQICYTEDENRQLKFL